MDELGASQTDFADGSFFLQYAVGLIQLSTGNVLHMGTQLLYSQEISNSCIVYPFNMFATDVAVEDN